MTDSKYSPEHSSNDALDDSNPLATIQAATGMKRPQDGTGGPASKRANLVESDDSVQVKVLIPSAAVGALIGKGGETMRNLKTESQCRVQMSKNQELYHGTNERICMVKGKISSVMMVMEAIHEKIREKVDEKSPSDPFDHKGTPRNKEMKLLMPNTSAGMVIGKSGASIKDIRDATGCQIQVFPKAGTPEAKTSQERVVTVAHDDVGFLMRAVAKVLEKVAADPGHTQSIDSDRDNFHQNDYQVFGGSSGGASGGYGANNSSSYSTNPWASSSSYADATNGSSSFRYNPMQGVGNTELLSFLDNLQATLRTSGFNEASVAEVMQAMQVLAKYNIMGLGLGLGVAAMAQMRQGDSSSYGAAGDTSFSGAEAYSSGRAPGEGAEAGGFATTVMVEKKNEAGLIEYEVPDAIIGAVLGPKAKTLGDIQQYSGCKVQVHKRMTAECSEGHRLITLQGDDAAMVSAREMIERVINAEQDRRAPRAAF